jgi:hypothetical protein
MDRKPTRWVTRVFELAGAIREVQEFNARMRSNGK